MLPTKLRFIWPSGFRGEDFKLEAQWAEPVSFTFHSAFEKTKYRTFHKCRCFLPSFGSFSQAVSEEKILKKSANQKQELPVAAMFSNGS